tara:strand:+ start:1702 stop:2355 length:654 start_codon:yes stop_codon:yes gene_type:complete
MKFDKKMKLHLATGDPGRYSMEHVQLEVDDDRAARLIATNGRVLVVAPVEIDDDDTAGPIPSDAIKQAVAHATAKAPLADVSANGTVRVKTKAGTVEHERPEGEEFAKWKQVVPKGDVVHRIALNPKLLLEACKALGAEESVVLEYREEKGPLMIRPGQSLFGGEVDSADFANRYGVIMPITLEVAVPDDAPLTAGQKAARTRKRNAEAKAAAEAKA